MSQATLAFATPTADVTDRVGFQIGWDHARHGQVPPPELLRDAAPLAQGWHAARAVFGRRTLAATRGVRQWLQLRLRAWREGVDVELHQLTPHHLTQLETPHCPVTRAPLGGAAGGDNEPVYTRLREDAGYAAGNVVVMSRLAAQAKAGFTAAQVLALAERLQRENPTEPGALHRGLGTAAWARLATLMAFAVELPHVQAARIPLRALPPNRVRVLNAAQGLQALLTLRLASPGWSRRASAVADRLPDPGLRHDFNLFVGALAARLMGIETTATPREQRWAQEDAWADARVQRRWQHFAAQLSAEQAETLLQDLADTGIGGLRLLVHDRRAATDGWGLPLQSGLLRSPRRRRPGSVELGRAGMAQAQGGTAVPSCSAP